MSRTWVKKAGFASRLESAELMELLSKGETRLDRNGLDYHAARSGNQPGPTPQGRRAGAKAGRRKAPTLEIHSIPPRGSTCATLSRWSGSKPVFLIAGESGAGKSWKLASLMEAMTGDGEPVVFVRGTGTTEDILTRAAREIWQVGLGETSDKTLQGVVQLPRRESLSASISPIHDCCG